MVHIAVTVPAKYSVSDLYTDLYIPEAIFKEEHMESKKQYLFEKMHPVKALAIMSLPTIASQLIILIYNLADTWFIGRTDDPYKIGASSLALTIYMAIVAIANIFGVGGGSLMVRLFGEKRTDEARTVASYSVTMAVICTAVLSVLLLIFSEPLLKLLGASDETLTYAKQYVLATTVVGGIPTVLSMCMPMLIRNTGYSALSGFGIILGSLVNIGLDPLFMFVLLPSGNEVLGAGIATALSNLISVIYFIIIFVKLKDRTVLCIPRRLEKPSREALRSLYSVGIPAAFGIFLYDLVTIMLNRLSADYGDIQLAAMGIVLKLERIPVYMGIGVCFGMVPLVAYNYGAKNRARMDRFLLLTSIWVTCLSVLSVIMFLCIPDRLVSLFISDASTVGYGADFLVGRCIALPFMMVGYIITNYLNAINKGKVSFILALIRHLVIIIPIMLLMNSLNGMNGLIMSQLVADVINTTVACCIFASVYKKTAARI